MSNSPTAQLDVEVEPEEVEAFVSYDIASYPSDLTLSVVEEMWKNNDIQIPDYQRNYVWSVKQASLLIESFLLGLPVPQVFFYVDEDNRNQVIDGQQRIMSVLYYFEGLFGAEPTHGKRKAFRLSGLAPESPFANKRFTDLTESQQRKLRSAVLRAINIRQLSPRGDSESVYYIFERLNTGGSPLSAQEIRNCVYRGELISILRELNKDKNWRRIIGNDTIDKNQRDVELILRVFALTAYEGSYESPMKLFLNKVMNKEKSGQSQRVKRFASAFKKAAALAVREFGSKPFRLRGPLNSSALDTILAIAIQEIDAIPSDIGERYLRLVANETFARATYINTSDTLVVKSRFKVAREVLLG